MALMAVAPTKSHGFSRLSKQCQWIPDGIIIQRCQDIGTESNTQIPHWKHKPVLPDQSCQDLTKLFSIIYQCIKMLVNSVKIPYKRFSAGHKPAKHQNSSSQKTECILEIEIFPALQFFPIHTIRPYISGANNRNRLPASFFHTG